MMDHCYLNIIISPRRKYQVMYAIEAVVNRFLIKNTDFFLKKNFKKFGEDVTKDRLAEISDV